MGQRISEATGQREATGATGFAVARPKAPHGSTIVKHRVRTPKGDLKDHPSRGKTKKKDGEGERKRRGRERERERGEGEDYDDNDDDADNGDANL